MNRGRSVHLHSRYAHELGFNEAPIHESGKAVRPSVATPSPIPLQ